MNEIVFGERDGGEIRRLLLARKVVAYSDTVSAMLIFSSFTDDNMILQAIAVHDTLDEQLVRQFCQITRQTKKQGKYDEEPLPIPCNMINCFCMYSDYIPRTLDEWIDYYSLGEDRRK